MPWRMGKIEQEAATMFPVPMARPSLTYFTKEGGTSSLKTVSMGTHHLARGFLESFSKRQNSRRYLHQSRILPRFLPFSASYKGSWKFVGRERDGSVNIRLEFSEWELVSGHKILKSHWIEERALVVPRLNYTWWIYVCCLIFRGWLMGDGPPINLRKNQVQ